MTVPDGPQTLEVYDVGLVRHVLFNRPERLNALTPTQHHRVIRAVEAAEADPRVRAIAFSGQARAFCAGDDLSGQLGDWPERHQNRRVDLDVGVGPVILQDAASRIRRASKPTVALMHGYAIGAGSDYATSCDFRVATGDCMFGDPRIHRALWAAEGWSYKLPRLAGAGRAARIALIGELLTGRQAYGMGLIHRLLPAGADVQNGARKFLDRLASLDPAAFDRRKKDLLTSIDLPARAAGL